MRCSHCGHPLTGQAFGESLLDLWLTPNQTVIIRTLVKANGSPVHKERLAFAVYGNRRDGGPEDINGCLQVAIHHLKPKVAKAGYRIVAVRSFGYRLERIASSIHRPEYDRPVISKYRKAG